MAALNSYIKWLYKIATYGGYIKLLYKWAI